MIKNNSMKRIRVAILAILAVFVMCSSSWAATYYVDGANGTDGNPGTLSSPWRTIGKANSTLTSGDTVYIREGTYYGDYINPSRSGTSGNTITYSNYNDENVTIRDASYGVRINGKSYITVNRINFYNLDHHIYIENNADHNEIKYCTFDKMRNYSWHGSVIWGNSQHNWIHHNTISRHGQMTGGSDSGALLDIGLWSDSSDHSYYNLIEDNILYSGGHHVFGIAGRYNAIRNNYIHNEEWISCPNGLCGNRVINSEGKGGAGWNLIEGNRIAFAGRPPDDCGPTGVSLSTPHNIVRFNSFYENGQSGLELTGESGADSMPDSNYIYSNTFYHNGYLSCAYSGFRGGMYFGDWGDGKMYDNVVKNNIFYDNRDGTAINFYNIDRSTQIIVNNWEEAGNPLFVNPSGKVPTDSSLPDLHLQSGSPCINMGEWLTTIRSSSGSGTSLTVSDAGYFMDGWGIIEGDLIQLEGQTQTARITDVDYNTNNITVDINLTWTEGQGLSLAYKGSAPDIGAYEFLGETSKLDSPKNLHILQSN